MKTKHGRNSETQFRDFVKFLFYVSGLRQGEDFLMRKNYLRLKKNSSKNDKIVKTLKENYPQYIWEASKTSIDLKFQ